MRLIIAGGRDIWDFDFIVDTIKFYTQNLDSVASSPGVWVPINFFIGEEYSVLANSDRVIFRTKKGRLFITKRKVDTWLIDKYQLDKFLILPE